MKIMKKSYLPPWFDLLLAPSVFDRLSRGVLNIVDLCLKKSGFKIIQRNHANQHRSKYRAVWQDSLSTELTKVMFLTLKISPIWWLIEWKHHQQRRNLMHRIPNHYEVKQNQKRQLEKKKSQTVLFLNKMEKKKKKKRSERWWSLTGKLIHDIIYMITCTKNIWII